MATIARGEGWHVAEVASIPPVKSDWAATWKSIRAFLGITGFGINAVTKDAGEVLIPEHDETSTGQQEVYFVHEGEVIGTFGGEEVRMPAGTLVGLTDPATKRQLVAAASPTTLLCIGSPPGKPYEVGPWEQ